MTMAEATKAANIVGETAIEVFEDVAGDDLILTRAEFRAAMQTAIDDGVFDSLWL